jgi:hypothetical protein
MDGFHNQTCNFFLNPHIAYKNHTTCIFGKKLQTPQKNNCPYKWQLQEKNCDFG